MMNWIRRAAAAITWRLRCQWAVLMARRRTRSAIATCPMHTMLVVCHGNIYRSPYAAELLRNRLAARSEVRSSGFHMVADRPSPAQHVQMSLTAGVNLSAHRSSMITADHIAWADAIVLMDRHNWQALRKLGADPGRLIWLGTLDGGREIPDPYGVSQEEAERIMDRLHRCTEALATVILARGHSAAP